MKVEFLLKNISNIFAKYEEEISNTRGNISRSTIKEKINKLHTDIDNFIKKDDIEQQVRKTHTSFFISGKNINSLDDAQAAANKTISSYSHEIITDKNTHNTTTQNTNINFITKVEKIESKKTQKLFKVKTVKKNMLR